MIIVELGSSMAYYARPQCLTRSPFLLEVPGNFDVELAEEGCHYTCSIIRHILGLAAWKVFVGSDA